MILAKKDITMTMMSESKFSEKKKKGNLSKMSRFEEISAEEARKTHLQGEHFSGEKPGPKHRPNNLRCPGGSQVPVKHEVVPRITSSAF